MEKTRNTAFKPCTTREKPCAVQQGNDLVAFSENEETPSPQQTSTSQTVPAVATTNDTNTSTSSPIIQTWNTTW